MQGTSCLPLFLKTKCVCWFALTISWSFVRPKEALDLRAAQAGGLVCTDLCELGNDFSPLEDQLVCCPSALPHFSPHSIGAPVYVLAGAKAVHRMRRMTALAMGVEHDFISDSKEISTLMAFN
eukprot:jgi/Botrbrau1/8490/Bobra.0237s0105.1